LQASKKALPPSKIVDALQKKRKEEPKIKQQTSKAETPKQPTTPAFKANFTGGFGQTPTYGVTQPGAFKRGGLYDTRGK
jgi:hypothetical protein